MIMRDRHIKSSMKQMSSFVKEKSGAERDRTDDLCLARAALSQLSYSPTPLYCTLLCMCFEFNTHGINKSTSVTARN